MNINSSSYLIIFLMSMPICPAIAADKMTSAPYNLTSRYSTDIYRVSIAQGIDPLLIQAVIKAESNFNTHAISPKGARGLMQLMPATQRELGVMDPFNPQDNISGGTRYLINLIKRYNSVRMALWAYNAGAYRVEKKGPPGESRQYADRVLMYYWRIKNSQ